MRPRKVEDVAGGLRLQIQGGHYQSGSRLPAERELARTVAVARTTLRSALAQLESEGYVSRKLGAKGGWFVTDLSRPADEWWQEMARHQEELRDIIDYRLAVECRAVELAAVRRRPETLRAMRRTLSRMRDILTDSPPARVDENTAAHLHLLDGEFHSLVTSAAYSKRLQEAVLLVRAELFAAESSSTYMELPGGLPRDHAEILEAIEARDSVAAAAAMRRHIEHGAAVWLRPAARATARA